MKPLALSRLSPSLPIVTYVTKKLNFSFYLFKIAVMAKTNAERQKEYRERCKRQADSNFLEKERKRQRKYYVKAEELTPKERRDRREAVKLRVRKHRETSKSSSQSQPQPNQTMPQNLIISLPFPKKGESSRKRKQ